ncbi:MAG: hypothetical protein JWL83_367 [Actinomycetia bacterium]|nr:hypothetical protein [Actinomycetes bacterium]
MINFRFHIISLVAVFLALALGILFGSAVGEPAIVDTLHNTIDNVRNRADQRRAENVTLHSQVDRLNHYITGVAPYAVAGRLTGVDVAVVAIEGVDRGRVNDTLAMLRLAGANAPMTVWLQARFALADPAAVETLASLLGSPSADPATLRAQALQLLAQRFSRPFPIVGGATTTTTTTGTAVTNASAQDILTRLVDAKFIKVDGLRADAFASFPLHRARALAIDGVGSDITDGVTYDALVTSLTNGGVRTVAAEISSDSRDVQRGVAVGAIRGDDSLKGKVSTIDDLDLPLGQVCAALALEQTAQGIVGDYGYGKGASLLVPKMPAL